MTALMAIHCPRHGATMEQRKPSTPEQAFCGVWWRCTEQCNHTVLFESAALRQQWRESFARTAYRSDSGRALEASLAAWDADHPHEVSA